jgi:hypothetical protein
MSRQVVQSILTMAVGVGVGILLCRVVGVPVAGRDAASSQPTSGPLREGGSNVAMSVAAAQGAVQPPKGKAGAKGKKPNIVYFLVDNLGFGELGCYGGGILRDPCPFPAQVHRVGPKADRAISSAGNGRFLACTTCSRNRGTIGRSPIVRPTP